MELTLHRQALAVRETVLEESWEQPVECDALLPDYCPDIARILKCEMEPKVFSARLSAARLDIDGVCCITVYYQTADGAMARCCYKTPFARTVELRQDASGGTAEVTAAMGYCNCRAVNQRRLDIRGAAALTACVCCDREQQAICGGEGPGLELRREPVRCLRTVGSGVREVQLSEQAEPDGALPESFLRAQAAVSLTECRLVAGKALVKGALSATLLWMQDGAWKKKTFSLPYSAVVELPGATEEMTCCVRQNVLDFTPETVLPDGTPGLLLTAAVQVQARCFAETRTDFVTDAYSTRHPCACHSVTAGVTLLGGCVDETISRKDTIPLAEPGAETLDVWGTVCGEMLTLSAVTRGQNGELAYSEQAVRLSRELPPDAQGALCWSLLELEYSPTAEGLEVRCRLRVTGILRVRQKVAVLDEIAVDESRPKENVVKPGLYLCLAGGDEALWDVAKRYNTSAARIAEENSGGGVLLIPVM